MFAILVVVLSVTLDALKHRGSDVELIANWVCGKDPDKAFAKPFGDSQWLTNSKDPLLYTDISGVQAPVGMKAVNYQFVKARMSMIRNGHEAAPAVLIVRASLQEPNEGASKRAIDVDKDKYVGRVYYVEVAIGNMAWHWLKVVVRNEGDKPKAQVLWAELS